MMLLQPSLPDENFTRVPRAVYSQPGGESLQGVNIPPEMIAYVDPHWLSFPPATPADHLILGFIYMFIFAAGVFGNGCVVFIFATTKSLRTSSNLFIANLAILDLVMMSQLPIFVANSLYQGQVMGQGGCIVFGLTGAISGMGAAVNNVAIAYDRYRSIANPMGGRLPMGKAAIICLLVWLWAMPFSLLPTFEIWNRFNPEGYLTTCSFDYLTDSQDVRIFTICIFTYAYLIPVLLLILFYSRILGQVREHQKMLAEQAKKMGVKSLSASQDEKSAEIQIAKVACSIFFLFLAAWTPYATVAMLGAFHPNRAVLTPFASMIPAIFCKTIACVDPWIYAISHPKFREQMSKRFPWLISEEKPKVKSNNDTASQSSAATQAATEATA
ncbi:Short wavelentgh sensitive B opsin 2 [Ephemera danica]|nr:Short wavelentgh sensitive B opsin 2 [Ephemera danica]